MAKLFFRSFPCLPGLLALSILIGACNTSRPARGRETAPVSPPVTIDKPLPPQEKPAEDSLAVSPAPQAADTTQVAGKPSAPDSAALGLKPDYNVVLALPFLKNRFNNTGKGLMSISRWSLNFYAGAKMALQELNREKIKLKVTVLDTEASTTQTDRLIGSNADLAAADLIIGPYRRDNIQLLAEFAKQKEIPLVSPYSASSNITEKNPYYLQVRPTLETHCQAILQHVRRHYRPEQILLIGPNQDISRNSFAALQQENRRLSGTSTAAPLEEYLVADTSVGLLNLDLFPFLVEGNPLDSIPRDTLAIIVPAWTSRDETFVYSLLRKLDITRFPEQQHVAVYGTPIWHDYSHIDLNYYEKLNVHISHFQYFALDDPKLRQFKRDFLNTYGSLPEEAAYLGHDVVRYFGNALWEYGTHFQDKMLPSEQLLHTRFDFEPVVIPTTTGAENNPVEQYENKFIYILKFQDYHFQVVD